MMEDRIDQILENVDTIPECGCHLYRGKTDGYSQVSVSGKRILVHRLALLNYYASIGDAATCCAIENNSAIKVRHKCDIKSCINPEHLELGSQADNMRDMIKRGRASWQQA